MNPNCCVRHHGSSKHAASCESSFRRESAMTIGRIASLPRRWPMAFGITVSALKTAAADVMAQTHLEGRQWGDIDKRRTFIFFSWGAVYLGGVQYFIYVHLFARVLFPSAAKFVSKPLSLRLADREGQLTVLKQVALDQFIHHPFILFPAFYCVKEGIERGKVSFDGIRSALSKYMNNILSDCLFCWKWWIPTFLVNFSVAPLYMRVPITAAVSFAFTSFLSLRRGSPQKDPREQLPPE